MPLITLRRPHPSLYGVPVLQQVDPTIFTHRYFTRCMECTHCGDWCCSHGVDVDEPNVARILARGTELEAFTGIERARWFDAEPDTDAEFPGGAHRRTSVVDGACVFLDRRARGCMLHAFCIARGLDYHELKPMVSALFPLTFGDGALLPSDEVDDGTLVCLGEGPTLYQGARDELGFYFGEGLVTELDALERLAPSPPAQPPRRRLGLV